MEMGRRFLLVGLYVSLYRPFHQGSVMQVGLATVTAIVYLTIQLQAMPFQNTFENYLALGCSLSLTVMFVTCIFYKIASFTELPDINAKMVCDHVSIPGHLVFALLALSAR
jgi:hypothetical protein